MMVGVGVLLIVMVLMLWYGHKDKLEKTMVTIYCTRDQFLLVWIVVSVEPFPTSWSSPTLGDTGFVTAVCCHFR